MGGKSSSQKNAERAAQEQLSMQRQELERMRVENETMQRGAGERLASMMKLRRGSRALLSDARLNPEQGVATLGASPEV
jgi:hypothetical protein